MKIPVYFYIDGTIVVIGKQPDGDSVRFTPDDEEKLEQIYRSHLLRPSPVDGSLQLRLEGIDTPETHYGKYGQPLGNTCRDRLLKSVIGFQTVEFKNNTVQAATPTTLRAAILTQAADIHGRPISYLLVGPALKNPFGGQESGTVTDKVVQTSANYRMVADGSAYAMIYSSMPTTHRKVFTAAANRARKAHEKAGIWPADRTLRFPLAERADLEVHGPDAVLIFPKLFRRAMDFLTDVEKKGFTGNLIDWLRGKPSENDQVLLCGKYAIPLSELIHVENDRYRFDVDVNDAVFIEK